MNDGTEGIKYTSFSTFAIVGTNDSSIIPNAVTSSISGVIIIPKYFSNLPITEIGIYAFYNCHQVTEVQIKARIKYIHYAVFDRMSSLKRINIPSSCEFLAKYAITLTTISVNQSSISAEIIIEPNSNLKQLTTYSFGNAKTLSIFLCGAAKQSNCESKWADDVTNLGIFSPIAGANFCEKTTQNSLHMSCLSYLNKPRTCNFNIRRHHFSQTLILFLSCSK